MCKSVIPNHPFPLRQSSGKVRSINCVHYRRCMLESQFRGPGYWRDLKWQLRRSLLSRKRRSNWAPYPHPTYLPSFSYLLNKVLEALHTFWLVQNGTSQVTSHFLGDFQSCGIEGCWDIMMALCLWEQGSLLWNVIEFEANIYSYLFVFIQCLLISCVYFLLVSICLSVSPSDCKYIEEVDF